MTQMQKIIKYCAIAFAVFLSITIFAAIFSAGWGILNAVGVINANDDIIKTINELIKQKKYEEDNEFNFILVKQ